MEPAGVGLARGSASALASFIGATRPIHLLLQQDLGWQEGKLIPAGRPGIGHIWDEKAIQRYRTT